MPRPPLLLAALALLAACQTAPEPPPPDAPAAEAPAAPTEAAVTVYVTEWCPYCRAAREYLDASGVPYRAVDIEASDAAYREYAEAGGDGSIPLIRVGPEQMLGYREDVLADMLRRNGI